MFSVDDIGGARAIRDLIDEVLACGAEAELLYRSGAAQRAQRKPDRSPVTEADKALEARLRDFVAQRFPGAAFLGEETGLTGNADARTRFVVDPIDGTRAFVRGMTTWSVLVGIEHDGEPVVGIALMPAEGDLFFAVRGEGAFVNGRPLHLSAVDSLEDATVCHTMLGYFEQAGATPLLERIRRATYTQQGGCDFDGYRHVLLGRAEAMIDPGAAPWDLCAVAAIVREAGGRLTSLQGEATIYAKGCVASNGLVHDALVTLLRA